MKSKNYYRYLKNKCLNCEKKYKATFNIDECIICRENSSAVWDNYKTLRDETFIYWRKNQK